MRAETALRRRVYATCRSVPAVKSGMSYRQAGKRFKIPKSTVWDHVQRQKNSRKKIRTALSEAEELRIVEFLLHHADRGHPLNRKHLKEAASIVISAIPEERKSNLLFREGIPGERWVRDFYKRHKVC